MGRRYPSERKPTHRRLLLYAGRLWTDVHLSTLFNRLQTIRRRQFSTVVREGEGKHFRVHKPSSSGLWSRRHHEHRVTEDISSGSESMSLPEGCVR